MKQKGFQVLFIIVVMSLSCIVSIANALSVTREYDVDFVVDRKYLTFHVKMVIETEPSGKWKTDTFYQIDYIVTLTYLNESLISRQGFSLFFHDPIILVDDWIYGVFGDHEILKNTTTVYFGQDGTLTLKYKTNVNERLQLKGMLNYQIFNNYTVWASPDWRSSEPIYIDIEEKSSPSPDYTTPFLYIAVGIVIAVVPTASYLAYKSRKTKRTPPTPSIMQVVFEEAMKRDQRLAKRNRLLKRFRKSKSWLREKV